MSATLNKIAKNIMSAMQSANKKGTSAYDTTAEVRRIEGDTAWVHIAGGIDETPVKLTISAKAGDTVQVRVGGGRAWITGNATAPPTDDKKAVEANDAAVKAMEKAEAAVKVAHEESDKLAEDMARTVLRINNDIADLQDQIDGNITTWFYTVDPSISAPPASDWISAGTESAHLGDLYYNTETGYSWRWQISNNVYSWQAISDTDVTRALADAARAQDTADSKRRVFFTQPVPPYDAGDLWAQGAEGDILRCSNAKPEGGTYSASDWVKASKYTDDSAFNTWLVNEFAPAIEELEEGITDAKVETFYQPNDPSTGWTAQQKSEHTGDLWYNSTASVQKYYRWGGSAWQELTATPPQAIFDSIDGKATIFTGLVTPTSPSNGDLWFKSASEPILTYVNGAWVEYNKYTDDTVANEAKTMATATQEHFWSDSSGAHITKKIQQEYSANPTNGGANTLIDSNGMKIRNGQVNLAQFLANSAVIGKESSNHVTIDTNGFTLNDGQSDKIMMRQSNDAQFIQFVNHNVYVAGRADSDMDSVTIGAYGTNDNVPAEVEMLAYGKNGRAQLTVSDIDSINYGGVVIAPNGVINASGTVTVYKDSSETARVRVVNVQGGDSVDLVSTNGGNVGVWSATRNAYLVKFDPDGNLVLGKSPRIGSHTSSIGDDIPYTENSRTSVSDPASLGYIDLPAGTWLIRAYVTFAGTTGADGYRRAYISDTAGNMVLQSFGVDGKYGAGNNIIVCNPYRVITVSSTTRYYLNASAPSTITISNRSMRAVRLL